ncbi:MAG: NeuD/PglB/VioB family sugar acetyltransferase [Acidimicrobiia bacterium]
MSRVVVVGGADQGRQTIDVLEASGVHTVVAVIDPGLPAGSQVCGYPVIGPDEVDAAGADGFVVAVGDNVVRATAIARVRAELPDLELVRAIHPAAVVARGAVVGAGTTLMAGAVVSNGCVVGEGVLMGTNASIDHDCTLGDCASLAPGSTTGGNVHVGAYTAVLLGAKVIHEVTIGAHAVIGAGAVVLDDVPDLVVAHGVPARVSRARVEGEPYLTRRTAR